MHNQLDRQKTANHVEKIIRKKVGLQATFFVCFVRALINLWFTTSQTEETDKQMKLRWQVVYHSHIVILSVWKTV